VFIVGFLFIVGLSPLFAPTSLKPVDIYPWISQNLVPTWVGALALSGVVAAALSTASSLLQQAGAALSRDIYQRFMNPNVGERQLMMISRVTVAIVAIFVYFSVVFREIASIAIINAFLFASSFWAAWVPALIGGLLTKRTTESGAFWGMFTGTVLALISGVLQIMKIKPDWMPAPILIALISSILVTVVVSLLTAPRRGEAEFFARSRPAPLAATL
jgi:Na+/proline symporter